jgi:hypothetical protein
VHKLNKYSSLVCTHLGGEWFIIGIFGQRQSLPLQIFYGYQRFFAPINVSSIHFIREWVSLVYATPTSSNNGKYVSHPFGLQMSKVA